jgi:hypothetical protein
MRVRCISEKPNARQASALGELYHGQKQSYGLTVGSEYLVFAISVLNGNVLLQIAPEFEQLISVPLFLFEVTDPRVPGFWECRVREDGTMLLWPPSFLEREYYHESLLEEVPSVVEDFRRVRRRLELEDTLAER